MIINLRKRRIYTFNVLNSTLIIVYAIKTFILLDECSYYNLDNRYHISCFFYSTSAIRIVQNIKKSEKYSQNRCVYIHKCNALNRGSYRYSTYIVKPGDTLFYIAWISGNNCMDLARNNNIKNMHLLKVGQVLNTHLTSKCMYSQKLSKTIFYIIKNSNFILQQLVCFIKNKILFIQIHKNFMTDIDIVNKKNFSSNISEIIIHNDWHWPTYGKVVDTFSESEGGNKGIDISGKFGQPILAVTNGKVVYVGNILKGYGNLIIIKHANDYLSAYAHNDMVFVSEQQKVNIGDKIATMGNSGTNEVKLHFEIKHKGKSVDPLCYLSKHY